MSPLFFGDIIMGYRSDVALAMAKKDWDAFCRLSAVSGCFGNEIATSYFDFVDLRDDGYVVAGAYYVKWYASYPDIQWIESALSKIPHQFLRTDEDPSDIEACNTLPDGRSYFEPVRAASEIHFHPEAVFPDADEPLQSGAAGNASQTGRALISSVDIRALIDRLWACTAYLELTIRNGRDNADSPEVTAMNIAADIQRCVIESWASRFFPGKFAGAPLVDAGRFMPADDVEYGIDRLADIADASPEEIRLLCALRLSDVEDAFRCNRQIALYFDGTPLAHALHCPPASYASPTEAVILLGKPGRTLFDLLGTAEQGRLKLQAVIHGSQKPDGVLVGWLSVPEGQKPGTQDLEEGLNEVLQSAASEPVERLVKASTTA